MAFKDIPDPGFSDDDGSADPRLTRALATWDQNRKTEPQLLAALAGTRLLVPVVAVRGQPASDPRVPAEEAGADSSSHATSDMAVPTLLAPDGRRALPAFTSVETLARWRPDARPVAVRLPQVLRAAAQEQAGTIVVDLAGPVTYPLTGAALRALAAGRTGVTLVEDPAVVGALHTVLASEPAVRAARWVSDGDTDGTVLLSLDPGASAREVGQRVAQACARQEVLRARLLRGLDLALLPPDGEPRGEELYRRPLPHA